MTKKFSWIEDTRKRVQDDEVKIFQAAIGTEPKIEPEITFKDEILMSSSRSKPVKVGGSDPGRQRDSFGFVGVKYLYPSILITGAQRWLGHMYLSVEEKIAKIHKQFGFDYQVIEVNNTGIHVFEVLKAVKGLPIIGVNTSKNLNQDPEKRYEPFKFPTMDKNDMARWMHVQNELGNLLFPREMTKELNELQRQISNIIEYKPEGMSTGNVKYIPEGTEHDDLYMALMLACWFIRYNLMNPTSSQPLAGAGYSRVKAQGQEALNPNDRLIETVTKRLKDEFNVTDSELNL